MNPHLIGIFCGLCLLGAVRSHADTESLNWIFVAASTTDGTTWHGDRYAKCIPDGSSGINGVTKIYRVEKDRDVLEHTYGWYTTQIYLSGASEKTSVVRFGRWNSGHEASTNDLALAFYYDGRLLKSYSTLDIAGKPDNVSTSVSHYTWSETIRGYGYINSPSSDDLIYGFTLKTKDGRILCFDVKTGEVIRNGKPEFGD
jgi:hypothetical protein